MSELDPTSDRPLDPEQERDLFYQDWDAERRAFGADHPNADRETWHLFNLYQAEREDQWLLDHGYREPEPDRSALQVILHGLRTTLKDLWEDIF